MDINVAFCKQLLKSVLVDVSQHTTAEQRKAVTVFKTAMSTRSRKWYLVEGLPEPMDSYECVADNAYDARYEAWVAWLKKKGVEGYTNG